MDELGEFLFFAVLIGAAIVAAVYVLSLLLPVAVAGGGVWLLWRSRESFEIRAAGWILLGTIWLALIVPGVAAMSSKPSLDAFYMIVSSVFLATLASLAVLGAFRLAKELPYHVASFKLRRHQQRLEAEIRRIDRRDSRVGDQEKALEELHSEELRELDDLNRRVDAITRSDAQVLGVRRRKREEEIRDLDSPTLESRLRMLTDERSKSEGPYPPHDAPLELEKCLIHLEHMKRNLGRPDAERARLREARAELEWERTRLREEWNRYEETRTHVRQELQNLRSTKVPVG